MVVEKLGKEERRVSEEIGRVEEQLQSRRDVLLKQEKQEALLKAELNSLTRGVEGGRGSREREVSHQGQSWLEGPAQGLSPGNARRSNHQGQPWQATTQGLSPGGAMSSAFYAGMAKHSPANSFLGERLDSSRR